MSDSADELEFNLRFAIQSLPDKKIRCPSNWSVLQLKQFLYEDCPSKPEVDKQRLIYAGHCLKNDQVLREIFNRNVEGIGSDNGVLQVVHLVCSSPEQIKAARQLNGDGLRNRQAPSSGFSSNTTGFVPVEAPTFADVPQDVNQAYAQAYHAHLRNYYSQNQQMGGGLQFSTGRQMSQVTAMANGAGNQQIPVVENNAVRAEANDHPDFLDLIYKLVRFAFLAAIVFYSSMDRIIFVVAVICLMWFVQMRRNVVQQNERVENVNPEPAPNPQPAANPNPNNENSDSNNNQIPPVENRASAWNVFWSTVISFFSSLIPEPIPMNVN